MSVVEVQVKQLADDELLCKLVSLVGKEVEVGFERVCPPRRGFK